MTEYKTTKQDFEYFKSEFQRWVDFWGLYEWSVYFLEDDSEDSEWSAFVKPNINNMFATVYLAKNHGVKPTKYDLSQYAFHECCELMLCNIRAFGELNVNEPQKHEVDQEIHRIIRRLENIVWEKARKVRGKVHGTSKNR